VIIEVTAAKDITFAPGGVGHILKGTHGIILLEDVFANPFFLVVLFDLQLKTVLVLPTEIIRRSVIAGCSACEERIWAVDPGDGNVHCPECGDSK